jgi:1,4-dihydroxy-2-naphthoate octaprenyltransferase
VKAWVEGARPRTLPAAVVPVLVGTAAASARGEVEWLYGIGALVVALAIQVGTNYANDYSDGVRGTDDAGVRVGPVRLVASGLKPAAAVKRAAFAAFGVAAVVGLWLAIEVDLRLLLVGAASIAAGWFYTGGPKPYGYAGWGEAFVFVFFGIVAVCGTAFVHVERVPGLALVASVPVGLLATALLVVNNLRDIPGDTAVGKDTLAVRIGDDATRLLYVSCIVMAFVLALPVALLEPGALLAFLAVPLAVAPVRTVTEGETGARLVPVLVATGRLQLAYGVLLAAGLALP